MRASRSMSQSRLPGVFKVTSLSGWIEPKLSEIQVSSWTTFLFLMNVSFIWYALGSQQMLSFCTRAFVYFFLGHPSYNNTLPYSQKVFIICLWSEKNDFSNTTGCSFAVDIFHGMAKSVIFCQKILQYGLFESQGLGIYASVLIFFKIISLHYTNRALFKLSIF